MTLLAAAARALVFAALLIATGAWVYRWLVLGRAGSAPGGADPSARIGVAAAALLLPALLLAFVAQFLAFHDPIATPAEDAALLLSLRWGRVWLAQVAGAALLLACFRAARSGNRLAWSAAGVLAALLSFTPGLSGHAAAVEGPTLLAMAADGLHVLAAGAWIGTLAVLAATSFRRPRAPAGVLLTRVRAFSPVALAAATLVAATGTVGAWIHLHRPADLWTSGYGRALSLKLLLFAAVVAMGAFNWRRGTPRLHLHGDGRGITRSILAELAFAGLVVLVTAWFVATAPPEG